MTPCNKTDLNGTSNLVFFYFGLWKKCPRCRLANPLGLPAHIGKGQLKISQTDLRVAQKAKLRERRTEPYPDHQTFGWNNKVLAHNRASFPQSCMSP